MYKDLGIKDRLKIINSGVKSGKTPALSILQYDQSLNGGYNEWLKQMSRLMGVDISKDPRYFYKQFYDDNPENAWNIVLGKTDGSLLQQYINPEYEKVVKQNKVRTKEDNINSLMDYSKYDKLINDYMNLSVQVPLYAYGGSMNIYKDGTDDMHTIKKKELTTTHLGRSNTAYGKGKVPIDIELSPEEYNSYLEGVIAPDLKMRMSGDYGNIPNVAIMKVPFTRLQEIEPNATSNLNSIYYYIYTDKNGNPIDYNAHLLIPDSEIDQVLQKFKKDEHNRFYWANRMLNDGSFLLDEAGITVDKKTGKVIELNEEIVPEIIPTDNNIIIETFEPVTPKTKPKDKTKNTDATDTGNNTETIGTNGSIYGVNGGLGTGTAEELMIYPSQQDMYFDMPQWEFMQFPGINWLPTPLEYLQPPGYVEVPNGTVDLVYDEGGVDFKDFVLKLAGYRDNSLRDALMAELLKPKDYFADPYASEHYTNSTPNTAGFDNDPYTKIQRESNGIPLYANGGRVNLFKEAGPVIKPTWNQFQKQYLDDFTRQNEEFLKQLEGVKQHNLTYGENDYYDWQSFGNGPTYKFTLPSGLKVYTAPSTQLSQIYPKGKFIEDNYYVVPNGYGLYSTIPKNGYVAKAIDYYLGNKPSGELEGADELRRLLNQITVQQSDNTSLYNTSAPTLTKPTTFSSTLSDNRYAGASIGPDNRTAYEREIARNRGELELWNLTVLQPIKELEGKVASTFSILDPTKHLGAAARKVRGKEGSYLDNLFSPENHGVLSALGDQGESFAELYPLLDFGINIATFPFITKGLGAVGKGIGSIRSSLYNNAVPFLSEGKWVKNLPTDAVAWRGGYGNANIRQARTTGKVSSLGTFKSPHFQLGSQGYKEVYSPSEMTRLNLIADESGRTQYVPVDMSGNPKGSPNFDPTMYAEGEVTPLPFNSAGASNFNVYKPIFGNPKFGYWKSRLAKPSSTTNTASSILGDAQPYKTNYSYVDQFKDMLNLSRKEGIHKMLRDEPLSDMLKLALRGESVDILGMPLGLDEIFNAQVVSRLPKDIVTQYTPKPGRATRIGDYITKQNLIKFDEFLDFLKNGRYAKIDLGLMDRIQGKEGTGGYFDLDDKSIVIADDNGNTYRIADSELYRRLLHEARHKYDDMFGLPLEQLDILMEAYPEDWETFLETLPEDDPLRTYENMAYERVTTNADARRELLGSVNNWLMPVEEQNAFMETLPSFDIVEAVRASNGYGRRYIKYLEDKYNGEIPENIIENFRKAAMKVGAITGLATGLNTMTD